MEYKYRPSYPELSWTTNPTAFVVTSHSGEMFRKSLGNKENFKMTKGKDFHEYIVDLDLEKNKEKFNKQKNIRHNTP